MVPALAYQPATGAMPAVPQPAVILRAPLAPCDTPPVPRGRVPPDVASRASTGKSKSLAAPHPAANAYIPSRPSAARRGPATIAWELMHAIPAPLSPAAHDHPGTTYRVLRGAPCGNERA